jgi:sugar phosphate isomerase/epimerase
MSLGTVTGCATSGKSRRNWFDISLAEWSLNRTIRNQKTMTNLDFPRVARQEFGVSAIEYVNQFFMDKATDRAYLQEMNSRAKGEGVTQVLIMCDNEGRLGDTDAAARKTAVENHHKWVEAAHALGCHSIRVNAQSGGTWAEQTRLAADGLRRLCEYGDRFDCNVIVENHGGLSSHGKWLSTVLEVVDHPRCGALPDFGNFRIAAGEEYDRYQGVADLMPYAKGVSAKSHDFDEDGNETRTDYRRMLGIVVGQFGWRGHIGIEYEGAALSEDEGIRRTLALLQREREHLETVVR